MIKFKLFKAYLIMSCFSLFLCKVRAQNVSVEYDMILKQGYTKQLSASLVYSSTEKISVFRWNNTENNSKTSVDDFGNSKFIVEVTDSIGTVNLINYQSDSILSRSLRFKEVLVLKEALPKISWEITSETKKFGELLATKALTTFRGRNYVAWFTADLPMNIGPWKLSGLPGLILEAFDEEGIVHFTFKNIRKLSKNLNFDKIQADVFSNGRIVGVDEYEELQNSLADEMLKKIMSKLPRGTSISVDNKTAVFLEKEF